METNKKIKNQPAFPFNEFDGSGRLYKQSEGMTLRDYFANSAMQVILKHKLDKGGILMLGFAEHCVSEIAYDTADAMLKQREL